MKTHLNTLFVTTQGAYLAKERAALAVRVNKETKLRIPLHNLEGIVCFGRVNMSPQLMQACAEQGVSISLLSEQGRFRAAIVGFTPGSVLLRRAQYRAADDEPTSVNVARSIILAKLANSRTVLLRAARDATDSTRRDALTGRARRVSATVPEILQATLLDQLRGLEGETASTYFAGLNDLITHDDPAFRYTRRSRRPPLDPLNALLSFVYTLLMHDIRSACEACGLDAAVGFLHRDRPGRPGLALDLMEEFRPWLADRLVISLINRRQIATHAFTILETGGVVMNEDARKTVLVAWQERKRDPFTHPFLDEKATVGMMIHLQARLMARYLRGDLDAYPPLLWK